MEDRHRFRTSSDLHQWPRLLLLLGRHAIPGDGVTIIVISNDDQNDFLGVATHVAANMFGASIAAPLPALAPAVSPSRAVVATIKAPHAFGLATGSDGTIW